MQIAISLCAAPLSEFTKYFTKWTLIVTTFSIWYSIKSARDAEFKKSNHKMALHNLLYTASILMNFVTMSVYWSLIHYNHIRNLKKQGENFRVIEQYLVHIIPGFSCMLSSYFTNCILTRKMLVPMLYFGVFYCFVNFLQTKVSGEPVYDFLSWRDFGSLLIVTFLLLVFSIFYLLGCKLDEYIKWDSFVAKNLR